MTEIVADHYETLQISPNADAEIVERAFRHLARRYHPDNLDSGDADRFTALVDAHNVLSNPEDRARYDLTYGTFRQQQWKIFDQESTQSEIVTDTRIRLAILSLLYIARRNDVRQPGMGSVEFERMLGCGTSAVDFHLWYLRENGWVQRLESGMMAITAQGVDRLFDLGGPPKVGPHLLQPGDPSGKLEEKRA